MADIKWIKITANMFDDEKIKIIESMPDKDSILVIWIKLLVQAGKTNANGYIFLNENIPYTDEMLATLFNRPLNTVRMALDTFKRFGMIESDGEFIAISNWDKHQNVLGMEKIREQNRIRKQKERDKKRLYDHSGSTLSRDVTGQVTQNHATELELELDKEKEYIPYADIINHLNLTTNSSYKLTTPKTKEKIKARWNEGFTLNEFITVIDKKALEWINDPKMQSFLRPETLFGTKFESYLNQKLDNAKEVEAEREIRKAEQRKYSPPIKYGVSDELRDGYG